MPIRRDTAVSNSTSTAEVELLDQGEHEGRLVYVADLGLHRKEYAGEYKGDFAMVSLGVEVIGKKVAFVDDDGERTEFPQILWTKPMYVYHNMSDKGAELKYYKVFDPSVKVDSVPDWEAQLGKPCNINVVHVEGKGANIGTTFANIDSLTPIPKKYQDDVAEAETEMGIGDADDPNNQVNQHLFGLAKWMFDRRIQDEPAPVQPSSDVSDLDEPDF